ncbi:MAG UNVERIFIED_CONTAM: nucleoside hydrolase [Planctomycetaceae bacterium]
MLNGRFGLGETEPLVPDLVHRRESPRLIVDLVREHPGELRIVSLGPLTNIAAAFELDPELPVLLNGLICLGGALYSGGDVTAAAEFNIWSDPQAARSVLRSPVGKILVPLDIMHGPGLTFEDIDRLTGLIPSTPSVNSQPRCFSMPLAPVASFCRMKKSTFQLPQLSPSLPVLPNWKHCRQLLMLKPPAKLPPAP